MLTITCGTWICFLNQIMIKISSCEAGEWCRVLGVSDTACPAFCLVLRAKPLAFILASGKQLLRVL